MDFKQLINYLNSLYDTFRKDWKFFNDSQIDAIKENTQAIENKEGVEEVFVKNPTDIEPIVEAQNATTEAIKAIPSVEIPKTDFSSLETKIEALKECLEKKEMSVNIGKTIVDTQGVIKAIEKLPKMMPKIEEKEIIDYTLMLDGIMNILERPNDHSEIKRLQELVKKLGTTEDLIAIAEWLKVIANKKFPEPQELPIKDGRILVNVDRVGGGGSGGLTSIETGYLKEIAENTADIEINADTINLNTDGIETKLDTLNTELQKKADLTETQPISASALPLPSGAATSAKQLPDGHNVAVNNFPSEYPLPASQISTLTPPAAITGYSTEDTLKKVNNEDWDTKEIDTTDPASIVITYKMGATTVKTKTINII
jgi:hypothetical protein